MEKEQGYHNCAFSQMPTESGNTGSSVDRKLSELSTKCYNLIGTSDLDNALATALDALKLAESAFGKGNIKTIEYVDLISEVYDYIGDEEKTFEYGKLALQISKSECGENTLDYADSLMSLSSMYADFTYWSSATSFGEQALFIYEKIKASQAKIIPCLCNIGAYYNGQNNLNKCIECYNKGISLAKSFYGEKHLETGEILYRMGLEYFNSIAFSGKIKFEHTKYKTALDYMTEALNIIKPIEGKTIHVADILCGIADCYSSWELNEYKKALDLYDEASKIYESELGEDHYSTAMIYTRIGDTLDHIAFEQLRNGFNACFELENALKYYLNSYHIYQHYKKDAMHQRLIEQCDEQIEDIKHNIREVISECDGYFISNDIDTDYMNEARSIVTS